MPLKVRLENLNSENKKRFTFLLPRLKPDADLRAIAQAGKWQPYQSRAFKDVAFSLEYKAPREVKNAHLLPTMWARPLLVEMALHSNDYPIHNQIVEQWQGMLAALALAEVRGFPLTAQLLELRNFRHEEFARSLWELLPSDSNSLYTLENKHPWEDIYIFLWNGQAVGMSSPSTLLCPSQDGKWVGLPWWQNSRLHSPIRHLNNFEKSLLWRWLGNLRKELMNHNGKKPAINAIGGLIDQFRSDLNADTQPALKLTEDPQFFGVNLNRGVLVAFNKPVKSLERPSNVRLIPSPEKGKVLDLLIIDLDIAKAWNEAPQHIWVHDGKTLASLKIEDLRNKNLIWRNVKWIESKDLFLPEFSFIDVEDAFSGAFLPKETVPLTFEGERITPLIPLNSILLDYLTPEDIIRRLQLQPLNSAGTPQVRVILDLPLAGGNYRIFKDYLLKKDNALADVPVLEIWPNFRAEGWKSYYVFYYDGKNENDTFQVHIPEAKLTHIFQDGRGSYQMDYLEQFPSFINYQTKARKLLGLILLHAPDEIISRGAWTIGVDFGTSFTNIYVNKKNVVEPLKLENLLVQVTEYNPETRLPVLFEYFIPENFTPREKPLPLRSILTIRGHSAFSQEKWQPIFDGRIYCPNFSKFQPQEDWLKTNLKWEKSQNITYNRLFIEHLALHISAIAAKNHVKEIQWSLSFPSAFSRGDKNRYAKRWQNVTKELQAKTGIIHNSPQIDNLEYFRSESLAVAQYFADWEGHDLVNTTCIDVGGTTSDISIWEKENLVHQCSVILAGQDLFSQFLELNPKFIESRFEIATANLKGLKGTEFNYRLDNWLRLEGDNWLNNKREVISEQPDFQGLIQLTAIGTAGLYYYVGILLKVLHAEGKYSRDEITPVYIGGNGGRFLHWLAEGGRFDRNSEINELLSRILSKASGFEDTEVSTQLSQNLKDEVACGLVLNQTKLQGLKKKVKDPLIAGEYSEINGRQMNWNQRLELLDEEDGIEQFKIPTLEILPKFLYDFHMTLKELEIEGIKPLEGYKRSPDPQSNDKLWRETNRELTNILLNIKGQSDEIRLEPPYILGLKALLKVLGKQWADKWSK
ncbi:hypothetical protein H6G08_27725 [Calothrix anomala FACHB-343]|uniref:Ppx/GppA phosphatase domain-containing protein n=2 Tax=Calothrix TaxID=1186 RepID=A0ABR8AI50_9CYAN|nr:hypothetical protein [Calothrix parietina FACHB-288]MBD2228230.1 hypothetical protein [Calothrix anomala FACHB-343]